MIASGASYYRKATLLRLRGTVFASQGDTIRALADLDAALERNANDVEALVQRAQVHRAAGDVERCFLDLRAAHILAPQVHRRCLHAAVHCTLR